MDMQLLEGVESLGLKITPQLDGTYKVENERDGKYLILNESVLRSSQFYSIASQLNGKSKGESLLLG